ncbi:hypothetical protein CR513_12112, partial [Mucuna pruriens]
MTQFLNGMNRYIVDIVEMYQYIELQEMVHQAIKVEQKLKRRNSLKKNSNSSSFPWKNNSKKEVVGSHFKAVDSKKNQIEVNPSKNRNIKCFKCLKRGHIVSQCLNKRTMIMKDNGEVEIKEEFDNDLMSFLKDDNEELPHDGDLLVVRRVLNMQKKGKMKLKEKNIFHTSDIGKVKVDKQVSVFFSIEKYKDEVLCDVVPKEAAHILLGCPQFDRKVTHNRYTNCFSYLYNKQKITLVPLSPKQVFEDQITMRKAKRV